ncbi:hypothetical protein [Geopseudomonas guangdongensis]|uniref:hypothetical protein n=1 Tax=Geopseudomonas guangdongensis TaxID=1245526 RepID=UPI0012FD25EC|nr:hypothetical protein [Pseudomonas guangdongensis]
MTARFGRIQLDRITSEWEEGHPINPRLLAGEVAALLRTLAPADHPIHETYASAILSATPGGCVVTYSALADYFESASAGRPAATITTSAGPVPGAAVLIWRQWLHTLAEEATKRATLVAGFAIPANDSPGAAPYKATTKARSSAGLCRFWRLSFLGCPAGAADLDLGRAAGGITAPAPPPATTAPWRPAGRPWRG